MKYLLVVLAVLLTACGPTEENGKSFCVDDVDTACTPQYDPTFDNIHERTIVDSCALSACHETGAGEGGFSLLERDVAYEELRARLEPGTPECGMLQWRLHADDPAAQMPPGKRLSDGELCAITQWIDSGAER